MGLNSNTFDQLSTLGIVITVFNLDFPNLLLRSFQIFIVYNFSTSLRFLEKWQKFKAITETFFNNVNDLNLSILFRDLFKMVQVALYVICMLNEFIGALCITGQNLTNEVSIRTNLNNCWKKIINSEYVLDNKKFLSISFVSFRFVFRLKNCWILSIPATGMKIQQ